MSSTLERCRICNEIKWGWRKHKCDPLWLVQVDEWHDEPQEIRGKDAEAAAIDMCERLDEGEYTLLNGEEMRATVYDIDDNKVGVYVVSGEVVPHYRARREAGQT